MRYKQFLVSVQLMEYSHLLISCEQDYLEQYFNAKVVVAHSHNKTEGSQTKTTGCLFVIKIDLMYMKKVLGFCLM